MSKRLGLLDLGRRPYVEVLELQRALCRQRMAGDRREDLLLLVEHEPVITLGRGTRATSLPVPPAELEHRGFAVAEVERGGDGRRYGGNSRSSIGVSLLSSVFLNSQAMPNAATIPTMYIESMIPDLVRADAAGISTAIIRP